MRTKDVVRCLGIVMALVAGAHRDSRACSQCLCGSPTPPGYLLGDVGGRFSLGLEDRYLSKTNVLDDAVGEERQIEHRVSALATWSPRAKMSLRLSMPYAVKTNTRAAVGEADVTTRSRGLGDAELLARLDAWGFGNGIDRRGLVALLGALAVPTGSNEARDALGERLDAHLQPGTGAWSGSAGCGGDLSLRSTALSASVLARFNGTNAHGYHYGDAVLFNLGCARTVSPSVQASLELNGRSAARDRTEDAILDPNSGGTLLYAAPGLRWSAGGSLAFDLLVQVPIAQALHGVQSEKTTGRLALRWTER